MCSMGKRQAERVSVPLTRKLREARQHPEYMGLQRGDSQARVYSRLAEIGWETVRSEHARRLEHEAYATAARDPEYQAVARALARLAREDGVI